MFTKKFLIVLLIVVVSMTACAPKIQVTSTNTPPTQQPMATSSNCSCFEGLSSGLDNATQARIRAVNTVMGADYTDIYVNGLPAYDVGLAQENIPTGVFSGWLYVTPGTYTIALVPSGETLDQALVPPTEVMVEAGHRYTVAAIGQLADKDVHPLVVDETALESGLGANPSDNLTIDINNLKGAESITELADGKIVAENIKYGEARAYLVPSGIPLFATLANSNGQSEKFVEGAWWAEPSVSFTLPWFGPYPAPNYDSVGNTSQGTSELNVLDFLAGFDGRDIKIDGHLATFNTFLSLVDKAGLRDQLINSGPYFLMAPTDEAFSNLPKTDLDALANDSQSLLNLLNAHIADGFYPSGSLSGLTLGHADVAVTNRLGLKWHYVEDYSINDQLIGPSYTVGNGNRVQIIYTLLSSN
jgi:uncharacterized surface protein with fasciclin (FAS1) repeats